MQTSHECRETPKTWGKGLSTKYLTRTSFFDSASSSMVKNMLTIEKDKEKTTKYVKELPKKSNGTVQKWFKCHGYGHFQGNCLIKGL